MYAPVDDPILSGFAGSNGATSGAADPAAAAFSTGAAAPGSSTYDQSTSMGNRRINPATGQPYGAVADYSPVATPIAGGAASPGFQGGAVAAPAGTAAPTSVATATPAASTSAGTTTTSDTTAAAPATVAAQTSTDAATAAAQAANPATAAVGSPSQIASTAPLPYQAFGNIPTVNPTDVDTTAMPGALQAFEGDNATALAPQFQAEDLSLQDNLASRGIVNSGAATYLSQNLNQDQDATLAGADSPLIQAFAGYYNQGQEANAAAGNATSEFNADQYGNVVAGNENAYNNYNAQLQQQGAQYGDALLSAYLGSYGTPNPSALSTLGQSPGQVGSAYQSGLNSGSGSSGAVSGAIDNVFDAFTTGNNTTSTPSYITGPPIDASDGSTYQEGGEYTGDYGGVG